MLPSFARSVLPHVREIKETLKDNRRMDHHSADINSVAMIDTHVREMMAEYGLRSMVCLETGVQPMLMSARRKLRWSGLISANSSEISVVKQVLNDLLGLELGECQHCGSHAPRQWMAWAGEDSEHVCGACLNECYLYRNDEWVLIENEINHRDSNMKAYNANPLDDFAGFKSSPWDRGIVGLLGETAPFYGVPYMGIELEVECTGVSATSVAAAASRLFDGTAIIKSDGSLRNGFEICSIPATLGWHKYGMGGVSPWRAFMDKALSMGLLGDTASTAGLHVHINRSALSPLVVGKFHKFINDGANAGFMSDVAGRPMNNNYAHIKDVPIQTVHRHNSDKYVAVNTAHDATYEVRVFRSTVIFDILMARIEFIDALRIFCQETSMLSLTYQRFVHFLARPEVSAVYPYLAMYLKEGELWKNKIIRITPDREKLYADVLKRGTKLRMNHNTKNLGRKRKAA